MINIFSQTSLVLSVGSVSQHALYICRGAGAEEYGQQLPRPTGFERTERPFLFHPLPTGRSIDGVTQIHNLKSKRSTNSAVTFTGDSVLYQGLKLDFPIYPTGWKGLEKVLCSQMSALSEGCLLLYLYKYWDFWSIHWQVFFPLLRIKRPLLWITDRLQHMPCLVNFNSVLLV